MDNSKERFRFALAAHGFTAAKLARRLGVPRQTVHAWLRAGLEHADAARFMRLCDILHVRAHWLINGAGLMEALARATDLHREHVMMLFDSLAPEALEIWVRVGTMLLSSNLPDADV